MKWSFSSHRSFSKCPRQWFYKNIYGHWKAKDPARQAAHRLSKLEGIQAWRGKLVDTVISDSIIPALTWSRPCSIEWAKQKADQLFTLQRNERLRGNGAGSFFEHEYGLPLTEEMFSKASEDIHGALENFFAAKQVWELLRSATRLLTQRTLSFKHGDATVSVRPDLILFRDGLAPVIFDWKVNTRPMRDYWLQLVVGAIALTRCTPHCDWPTDATNHHPAEIALLEVQLLAADTRVHQVSEADVDEAEDFISASAATMRFAVGEAGSRDLTPENYPVTSNPTACKYCPYRRPCWGSE